MEVWSKPKQPERNNNYITWCLNPIWDIEHVFVGTFAPGKLNAFKKVVNIYSYINTYGCFQKYGYPQIIHFNVVFHYKSSILEYPYFWVHPYRYFGIRKLNSTRHLSGPITFIWRTPQLCGVGAKLVMLPCQIPFWGGMFHSHDGSMEMYTCIYLHEWLIFMGFHVGKYTVRPMDPMGFWIMHHSSSFKGVANYCNIKHQKVQLSIS